MQSRYKQINRSFRRSLCYIISLAAFNSIFLSCDEFVKIDPPRTELVKATVFTSDATANAAILDMYFQMRSSGFASGDVTSISYLTTLSSDEQLNYFVSSPTVTAEYQQFNDNMLIPNNSLVLNLWTDLYKCIYKSNAVEEGLMLSSGVTENLKSQLLGEAKFMRAFCHFYLVNLFGEIPLVTSTDYRTNAEIPRAPVSEVYNQIITDLIAAQELLIDTYLYSNNERVRANKGAATALLARVYLYNQDWENAEMQATQVINNTSMYSLASSLSNVFLVNSTEAILQLWSNLRPNDRDSFRFVDVPLYGALRPQFVIDFETGDLRATTWTSLTPSGYYRTLKYNSASNNPPLQYSTALRLAEQYLIRAEARAHQNNIAGAQSDLNVIRARAGLSNTTANDQTSLLSAIQQERRSEFFTEWGHRWFDLKRTGRTDAVLGVIKGQWISTAALFPIPESQILNDPAMKNAQNPGY